MNNQPTLLMVIEDVKEAARESPYLQNGPELFRKQVDRLLKKTAEQHAEYANQEVQTGRNMEIWHKITDNLVNQAIRSIETGAYLVEKPYDSLTQQKVFAERLDRVDPLIDRKWVP